MSALRRKVLVRVLERAAVAFIVLDVALVFAFVRPLDKLAATEWRRMSTARHRVQEAQARVSRLEMYQKKLPEAREQIKVFQHDHVPPRRRGFSRAWRLVRELSEQSGIQLSSLAYRLNSGHEDPLERLGIEVNVVGPYPGLLKFAHALETASDFVLLQDFTFSPGQGGSLELRLTADMYLVP
jgi:Tfp pilus assembly protein PilO